MKQLVLAACAALTTLGWLAIVVLPSRKWRGWWHMVVEFPEQAPSGVKVSLISPALCQNGWPGCENQGGGPSRRLELPGAQGRH